jgi:hypothetical protein
MRVPALLFFLPLLAGCTDADWDHVMSFASQDRSEVTQAAVAAPAPAVATPAAAPGAQNAFCLDIARQEATSNGFDQATQQRVALRSYQQCVALYGASDR